MNHSRGIVLSPQFEPLPNRGISSLGSPSPADIRKYLLYWDEIDYPDNNCISLGACPDIQFLIDARIATRTRVLFQEISPSDNDKIFVWAQQAVFEKRQQDAPGQWSLAQLSKTPHFIRGKPNPVIEYELWNALPVPQREVPLNNILEFKSRRLPELLALRAHLDELYEKIISSSDVPRAKNSILMQLESDLLSIDRTLGESRIPKELTSLRGFIPLAVESVFAGGGGAIGISQSGILSQFDINLTPALAGAIGSCFYFAAKTLSLPPNVSGCSALTYVSSVKRDL